MNPTQTLPTLNPEQSQAADHIDGPMIVLAGPGTGKTQIIASRIATILEKTQLDPHNVLCLTFTEAGVVAMRERLLGMIGTAAYYVRIHTFHSFCNEVIKDFPEKFLNTREMESLTDIERVQLFRSILDELPVGGPITPFGAPYFYQRDLIYWVQQLKREDISPESFDALLGKIDNFLKEDTQQIEDFIEIHGAKLTEADVDQAKQLLRDTPLHHLVVKYDGALEKKQRTAFKNEVKKAFLDLSAQLPRQRELAKAYDLYQKKLIEQGRYDYEDMILLVVNAFKQDKALLAHYQEQFQYLLVDEYQDTNGAQNEVVQLIGEYFESPNIFVVGDDKQSIYRFQGASLENILYFYRLYKKNVQVVSLKSNYRSQQTILDAAHQLIQKNQHALAQYIPELSQELKSERDFETKPLELAELSSPGNEHYFIAKKIKQLIELGTEPKEIAVLFRNNSDAEGLADLMLRLELPFRMEVGQNLLKNRNIQHIIRLLTLIENPTNDHELFYTLHFEFLGFTSLDIHKASREASKERVSLSVHLEKHPIFGEFIHKLYQWKSLSINRPLTEFFDHVIKESGYLDFVLNKPNKLEELNRLNTFFDELKTLNRASHELTLEGWLKLLDLQIENDIAIKEHELKTQENGVRLMTAHKSKGREFEHVFIMNCVDKHWGNQARRDRIKMPAGLLKTDLGTDQVQRNEDERRLFYVALTRAKKSITLSYAKNNDNGRPQVPSIFLSEIPEELMQPLDVTSLEEEATQRLQTIFLTPSPADHSEEEASFVRQLLENYTMSVTHLNNYLRCPRLFYYQNLLRVPAAKNKHAAFGSAVHESLKDFTLQHQKGELPSEDYLQERFEAHMKREVLTQQDRRAGVEFGRQTLHDYYKHYEASFDSDSLPEYDFSSHGVNLDGVALTGKLDRIQFLDREHQRVHVVDYKTGNPDSKREQLGPDGDYRRQIVFYKLLCDLSPKFPYEMVSGEIDFVQKGTRTGEFKREVIKVTPEELSRLKSTIKEVHEEIMNLEFLNPDEWNTCGECEYCQFFSQEKPLV